MWGETKRMCFNKNFLALILVGDIVTSKQNVCVLIKIFWQHG